MSPIYGSPSALKRTCYVGYWLYGLLGFFLGFAFGLLLLVLTTDVTTPVANEPKCETIIIHRK